VGVAPVALRNMSSRGCSGVPSVNGRRGKSESREMRLIEVIVILGVLLGMK